MFSLTQPQVLELLAEMHRIDPSRPTAIRGRVQAFQRVGVPRGTQTGRGRPAHYGVEQLIELLVAFEMLQLGMTPERIALIIRDYRSSLQTAAALAAPHVGFDPFYQDHDLDAFIAMDPSALTVSAGEQAISVGDIEHIKVGLREEVVSRVFSGVRRTAIINLTEAITKAGRVLQSQKVCSASEWKRSIALWISEGRTERVEPF